MEQPICQCCGMPMDASTFAKNADGTSNEEYCKWCYVDGKFTYSDMQALIDFCAAEMASEQWPEAQIRAHMQAVLPTLKHWK